MKKKLQIICVGLIIINLQLITHNSLSQNVGINDDGSNPETNTMLDIKSSGTTASTFGLKVKDSGANDKFVVRDDGSVGIGTNTPDERLDVTFPDAIGEGVVFQNANGKFEFLNGTGAAGSMRPTIRGTAAGDNRTGLMLQGMIPDTEDDAGKSEPAIEIAAYESDGSGVDERDVLKVANGTTDLITVDKDGNIGVGTSTPTKKLQVIGSADIMGTVGYFLDEDKLTLVSGSTVEVDATANEGSAIFRSSSAASSGVTIGPYVTFTGGNYLIQFRMKVADNSSSSTIVRIDAGRFFAPTRTMASYNIKPSDFRNSNEWQIFTLPIEVRNDETTIEFRCTSFNGGITDIWLDYINVIPGDQRGFYSSEFTVDAFGNIGIGTATPAQSLDVVGNGSFTGSVTASCGTLSCSDIRYKANIKPIESALEKTLTINGVTYDWKKEEFPEKRFNDKKQIGVIAQEVESIYPELVHTDEKGFKSVDYSRLTPILIEAIKEQQAIINNQQDQIKHQKSELGALTSGMNSLKKQVDLIEELLKTTDK